jgi:protein-disulfide isomerase
VLGVQPELVEKYAKTGKVKLVFRDVLNHSERSVRTSEAAACAGRQGQFFQMHSVLFTRMNDVWATSGTADLQALMNKWAGELPGLDRNAFAQCISTNATLPALQAADAEQRKRGIVSQPIFEVTAGGKTQRIVGGQPFAVFDRVLSGN